MAVILINGDKSKDLAERLREICSELNPVIEEGDTADCDLLIRTMTHWDPSWSPPPGKRPVLLISRREPADPIGAFMTGIDAWLSEDCDDAALKAQVKALLPATSS